MAVFKRLHAGEGGPEQDGEDQAYFRPWRSFSNQRVMRPGHRGARGQQQQRIQQRQCQGSKVSMPLGGQTPPNARRRVACTGSPGNSDELKNAQNQATKNITSEAMKGSCRSGG